MLKHYVEYLYPGILVSKTSVKEVAERDVKAVNVSDDRHPHILKCINVYFYIISFLYELQQHIHNIYSIDKYYKCHIH